MLLGLIRQIETTISVSNDGGHSALDVLEAKIYHVIVTHDISFAQSGRLMHKHC